MPVVAPASRLRRGVRRIALTICALALGAGFSPALPSTVESTSAPVAEVSIAFSRQSTVEEPAVVEPSGEPPDAAAVPVPVPVPQWPSGDPQVGAAAGRAPPRTSV
ncbi:hypothetical protein Drose_32735 [Dactylosporangium roseum]|uniref:Uncharacterized protein n=1 Tax=Dactylosporangium roseum TaxID=47989 RepID=A0ABY5Z2W0_9ACTN|nr:hypothetical protein [Dactylosporangium roseum]UWZ35812.1 hypothetical protein Drose_32735 [Dactylosporangium roseum]